VDRQLKQRVVGAAVLVALCVVFIPIFLDNGALDTTVPDASGIPPAPDGDFSSRVIPLSEEKIDELEAQAGEPPRSPVAETSEHIAAAPEVPAGEVAALIVDETVPGAGGGDSPRTGVVAWSVQLGSFSNDDNARRLIEKLRDEGFPAYLERRLEQDGSVFKVRVGPEIRREDAERLRARLEQKFALKGIVLRYR
jgi:DedD protein